VEGAVNVELESWPVAVFQALNVRFVLVVGIVKGESALAFHHVL
jgi:hypothetical protein